MSEKSETILHQDKKVNLPPSAIIKSPTENAQVNMIQPVLPGPQLQSTFLIPTLSNNLYLIDDNSLNGKPLTSIQVPIINYQNPIPATTSSSTASPIIKDQLTQKKLPTSIVAVLQPQKNNVTLASSNTTVLKKPEEIKNQPSSNSSLNQPTTIMSTDVNKSPMIKQETPETNSKRKRPHSLLHINQSSDFLITINNNNQNTKESSKASSNSSTLKVANGTKDKEFIQTRKGRPKRNLPSQPKLRLIGASRKLQPQDQAIVNYCFDSLRNLINKKANKMKELTEKCIQVGKIEYTVTIEGSKVDANLITAQVNNFQKFVEEDIRKMELAINAMEKLFKEVALKNAGLSLNSDCSKRTLESIPNNLFPTIKHEQYIPEPPRTKFVCKFCNHIFFHMRSLSSHVELEHRDRYPSPDRKRSKYLFNETCNICGRKFHSVIMLNIHKATYHSQRVSYKSGTETSSLSSQKDEDDTMFIIDHNYSKSKAPSKKSPRVSRPSERFSPPGPEFIAPSRPRGRPRQRGLRPGRYSLQNNLRNREEAKVVRKPTGRAITLPCVPYVPIMKESYRESLTRERNEKLAEKQNRIEKQKYISNSVKTTSTDKRSLSLEAVKRTKSAQEWSDFRAKSPDTSLNNEQFTEDNWNKPYFDPDIPLDCSDTNPIILLEPLNQDIINAFKSQSLFSK